MNDLARRLVIARGDGIALQKLLNDLSHIDLLLIDDFDSDLFAILANCEH
ncbi:MAG: AAA family ATPase, partial [Kineosporiaceae bacterium]|nr:AAA family ATPase [Aeromicrobium sp.]